jgi:hypothetical protein
MEIEILNIGERPIRLVKVEAAPDSHELFDASETSHGRSQALDHRRIGPTKVETIKLVVRPKAEGLVRIRPKIIFVDESGLQRERLMEPTVVPNSGIIEFLADSFVRDYTDRRLASANCGWRTLMEIVNALKIPRSHVYGESRYGRTFGKQLESLVKSSLVEYRIFPGERGRGGDITRVRVFLDNEDVKKYVEQLNSSPGKFDPLGWATKFPVEYVKAEPETVVAR